MILVSCAVIFRHHQVLSVRRAPGMSHAGYWEFPGGKQEENESAEACLIREIREELAVELELFEALPMVDHSYDPDREVRLKPFVATIRSGEIQLLEHDQFKWLGVNELFEVNWVAADCPIVHHLHQNWDQLSQT